VFILRTLAAAATGKQEGTKLLFGEWNAKHPNVLAYTDSWEEDSRLFIRTELCELASVARLLWKHGRVYRG
jgi:hypothetical protein